MEVAGEIEGLEVVDRHAAAGRTSGGDRAAQVMLGRHVGQSERASLAEHATHPTAATVHDPVLEPLRNDDRWQPLLSRVGLSDEQIAEIVF